MENSRSEGENDNTSAGNCGSFSLDHDIEFTKKKSTFVKWRACQRQPANILFSTLLCTLSQVPRHSKCFPWLP